MPLVYNENPPGTDYDMQMTSQQAFRAPRRSSSPTQTWMRWVEDLLASHLPIIYELRA